MCTQCNCLTPCISLHPLGDFELASILLRKGADPYISVNTASFGPGSRGFGNAFAAAAAHGHKNILRKLLAEPGARRDCDMLSLAEILSEGGFLSLFLCIFEGLPLMAGTLDTYGLSSIMASGCLSVCLLNVAM